MLEYVTIGVKDLDRAAEFYDPVFEAIGCSRSFADDKFVAYGRNGAQPSRVYLALPYNGESATSGNGSMVALTAQSRAEVRAFHTAVIAGGGQDEGEPGVRKHYALDFYAAYARDPDGNKLAVVCRSTGET